MSDGQRSDHHSNYNISSPNTSALIVVSGGETVALSNIGVDREAWHKGKKGGAPHSIDPRAVVTMRIGLYE
jgi:hypothetical protein